jgi:predicted RNase H-like nuclease (RuvC/YqgF family)
VDEVVSKAGQSETDITALSHELKQKDTVIEELQRQLRQLRMTDTVSLSPVAPHELSDFNTNDGGLHGVVRAVEEVSSLIQVWFFQY